MDKRDLATWVVVELTPVGEEKVSEGTLETSLRRDLKVGPDFGIFIPSTTTLRSGKSVIVNLFDGYAFLASGLPETAYFALERQPYIQQVMSIGGKSRTLRALKTVPDSFIEDLRDKLKAATIPDFVIGMTVYAAEGRFRGLSGPVVEVLFAEDGHPLKVMVKIELRSKVTIVTFEPGCLSLTEPDFDTDPDEGV